MNIQRMPTHDHMGYYERLSQTGGSVFETWMLGYVTLIESARSQYDAHSLWTDLFQMCMKLQFTANSFFLRERGILYSMAEQARLLETHPEAPEPWKRTAATFRVTFCDAHFITPFSFDQHAF